VYLGGGDRREATYKKVSSPFRPQINIMAVHTTIIAGRRRKKHRFGEKDLSKNGHKMKTSI